MRSTVVYNRKQNLFLICISSLLIPIFTHSIAHCEMKGLDPIKDPLDKFLDGLKHKIGESY